ncbi:MAG TPA: biopolymer transporter ExbD [Chitinophagaceae bacterium]|nr:biopolymer transporter ExbD [Chitinophagaceae bacterium]
MDIFTNELPRRPRAGVTRLKKGSVKTDMTPMVDLGFLLIAFFVMTTELSKPSVVTLAMPKGDEPSMPVGRSTSLTVLLGGENEVYYYVSDWPSAVIGGRVFPTTLSELSGIGHIIRERQGWLAGRREELMLMIKPGKETNFRNLINILDEATINKVKRYAVLKQDVSEKKWMENRR